jgi:uncharacterized membrane protein (UPF0127 family)
MIQAKAQASRAIKVLIFLLVFPIISACDDTVPHFKKYSQATFQTPSGKVVNVYIAKTDSQQKLGLSGIKPEQFADSDAMLFPTSSMRPRQFWMPETFMDLDLFFMNEDYYILDIHRGLKHHKTRIPERDVPRSKTVYSQHVLEMKSSSPLAKELEIGMKLNLKERD